MENAWLQNGDQFGWIFVAQKFKRNQTNITRNDFHILVVPKYYWIVMSKIVEKILIIQISYKS